MANKILTEDRFDEFVKSWRINHEEMHAALEELIDSDKKVNEIYVRIYDNYYMTGTALRNYTNLPKHVVADLQNDISVSGIKLSDMKRRALVEYFRSVIYCGNYCALTRDEFSQLFEMLIVTFSSVVKKHEFAELSSLSANDIARILNGTKNLTAAEQKDILLHFHSLCYDALKNEMEEFTAVRKLLETLMGEHLVPREKKFYDTYFSLCDDINFEKFVLSCQSCIRLEDLERILDDVNYTYYPMELQNLARVMFNRSRYIIPKNLHTENVEYLKTFIEQNVYDDFETEDNYWEITRKVAEQRICDWFITLPDVLKNIVYEYAQRQIASIAEGWYFDGYIVTYANEVNRYYEYDNKLTLICDMIEMFRALSIDKKSEILDCLHKSIAIPFPAPSYKCRSKDNKCDNSEKAFSECAVFSFCMSYITEDGTLSDKYSNAPLHNTFDDMLFARKNYKNVQQLMHVNKSDFLMKMLHFTSDEWQLVGYIEAAIVKDYPLSELFCMLGAEPCDLEYDDIWRV